MIFMKIEMLIAEKMCLIQLIKVLISQALI